MKSMLRVISVLLILCAMLAFSGCGRQEAGSGWVSRTGWYGCMSDTGYYYADQQEYLHFVDLQSNVSVALCQKVGCDHGDPETCEAYLKTRRILLWKEHLYYLSDDAYGTHLYRRDDTGQSLVTVGTLCEDIRQKERNISISVVDTLISDGFLYYYASITKQENEGSLTVGSSYRDVIRRMELASGKETTVVESADCRLELFGIRGQEVLYSSTLMPEGLTEDNAAELLENTTTKLYFRNMESGQERLLFEKHRDQMQGSVGFADGKLFYLYYRGKERCHSVYDVETETETALPSGFLTVISSRYALLRDKEFHYTLLDLQKGKQLPVESENRSLRVDCASGLGVVLQCSDRKAEDGKKKLRRYAFVREDGLADGIDGKDLTFFYEMEIG